MIALDAGIDAVAIEFVADQNVHRVLRIDFDQCSRLPGITIVTAIANARDHTTRPRHEDQHQKSDQALRLLAGAVILLTFIYVGGDTHWLGFLALLLLITGVVSTCPLYSIIGVNTCRPNEATESVKH